MKKIFGETGLLSQKFSGYEYRPSQLKMAEAVSRSFREGNLLIVEAETGIGKTLAYLIPAIHCGRKVVISTGTKNLQEQLFKKDLPLAEKVLGQPFKSCCIKGRRNYLCLWRYAEAARHLLPEMKFNEEHLSAVGKWLKKTESGDIEEAVGVPENSPIWQQLTVDSDSCLGSRCSYFSKCFVTKIRQKAMESDIVIVNHHLYFADLAVRRNRFGEVIPEHNIVVFDEAHSLEKTATNFFGLSVSYGRVNALLSDIQRSFPRLSDNCQAALTSVKRDSGAFFEIFRNSPSGNHPLEQAKDEVLSTVPILMDSLTRLGENIRKIDGSEGEVEVFLERCKGIEGDISFISAMENSAFVYWYERGKRSVSIKASPVDVSSVLTENLFNSGKTIVLTSATMTVENRFDFIKKRLGVAHAEELRLKSLFDYSRQSMLFFPEKMPEPRYDTFRSRMYEELEKIVEFTSGGAFFLFTSFENLNYVYDQMSNNSDFPLYRQGDEPKSVLLENFRKSGNGILFGTFSFWEGVDVQGSALRCVVIDKLPFEVPSDPVVSARSDFLKRAGKNPFAEYHLPQAAITLKQGLGRLIRSTKDKGLLAVIDPRIRTKSYGKIFLNSIPPSPVIRNLGKASTLFENIQTDLK